MKLNNKGFAISTFMYMILVLAIVLILATLAILSSRNMILDKQKNTALQNIKIVKTYASKYKSYVGYYADADGDGTVDGVIYADLAYSKSGKWVDEDGIYSYEAKDNLKEYTISENNSLITTFETNKIISLKPGSTGNDRFYVMALNDFTAGSMADGRYYWYYSASEAVGNCGNICGNMIPIITEEEFGTGYENTRLMINKWNAAGTSEGYANSPKNNNDIWKHIQTKYEEGWFIPSKEEWAAFADYLANKTNNFLSTSNYNNVYGLSIDYWTSSQRDSNTAWLINFSTGYVDFNEGDIYNGVYNPYSSMVRFSITF